MPLYDWGSDSLNMQHYGQKTPPEVDFSKINIPTAWFVGDEDPLGDITDATKSKQKMNSKFVSHFELINGGHLTFMVGKDMSYFDRVK